VINVSIHRFFSQNFVDGLRETVSGNLGSGRANEARSISINNVIFGSIGRQFEKLLATSPKIHIPIRKDRHGKPSFGRRQCRKSHQVHSPDCRPETNRTEKLCLDGSIVAVACCAVHTFSPRRAVWRRGAWSLCFKSPNREDDGCRFACEAWSRRGRGLRLAL
jgi:hypothetical protein